MIPWNLLLELFCAIALIMIIARTLGKTTVAQMTYHDFVAAITLGAITANLAFNIKERFLGSYLFFNII